VSDSERPDIVAFQELEQLIRVLGDEMAAWRRRAHEAEARLKDLESRAAREAASALSSAPIRNTETDTELERENQELRQRLETARQRTRQLLERLRFLRQQHELGAER
jgi:hypothetical protein